MSENSQDKNSLDKGLGFFKCKKRDRGASEERLIAAGLEVFAKFGFGGSTTKMIAKKADCNESLIGRYFDGKEGLLLAIFEKFVDEMVHQDLRYPPQPTLSLELEHYVKDRVETGCKHEEFARIMISQALVDKKFKKRAMQSKPMTLDQKMVERVQLLSDAGKLKDGSVVEEICHDIDTYMDGVFFFDLVMHETPPEEVIQKTVRFVKKYSQLFEKT